MQVFDVLMELPEIMYTEIGRIAAAHSYLEYALSLIVQDQLRLDPKKARIAVRDPRSCDTFEMIKDLAALDGISIPKEYKNLAALLAKCKSERDSLAHGIWLIEPKSRAILLRLTAGTWQPDIGMRGKVKRKAKPEGTLFAATKFESIHADIMSAIDLALSLREHIKTAMDEKT